MLQYRIPPELWSGVSTALYGFDGATGRWNASTDRSFRPAGRGCPCTIITWKIQQGAGAEAIQAVLWELRRRIAPWRPSSSTRRSVRFAAFAEECSPQLQHRTLVPINGPALPRNPGRAPSQPSRHRHRSSHSHPSDAEKGPIYAQTSDLIGYEIDHPCVILLQGLTGAMLALILDSPWVQDQFLITPGPQSQRGGGWPDHAKAGNLTLISRALSHLVQANPYVVTFPNSRDGAHAVFVKLRLHGGRDLIVANSALESAMADRQAEQMACLRSHLAASAAYGLVGGLGQLRRALIYAADGDLRELCDKNGTPISSTDCFLHAHALEDRVLECAPIVDDGKMSAGCRVTLHFTQ